MRLRTGLFSGSAARVDNLRLLADVSKLRIVRADRTADFAAVAAPCRLASMPEILTPAGYGVFTNSVKSCMFRRLRRRLVRVIHPDRSELASA